MTNTSSPRLSVEITAMTDGLKKGLAEARAELKKFATEAGKSDYKTVLQQEKVAQAQARTEATQYRTEIAKLALEKKRGAQATQALSGSYREAQQRLTALGASIRNAQGGFTNTTPAIRAQITEYRKLNEQLKSFDKQMGLNYRNVGNYGSALSSLSPQLSSLTASGGGFLGLALGIREAYKTVSTFDSGMRNVEKTTGLTRKEVDELGKEFVNLSKSLKVIGANQLTQYATIAGQLGVKGTRDILAFTEALAKLETATNISGEEGGSEIARTLTLVDGGVQNVKAFGDEIVNLGNNFAATEKEILANAESIAQNVGIYRIGRQEVLAYATATKSVGIEAELVGSTFNRTLAIFEKSIRTGDGLNSILKLIGGTQSELSKRFKQDASGVFLDFIGALNRVYKAGGSVNEQLEKIGVDAVRDQRVLQSLAANGYDVLTRAMETAKNAAGALDAEVETAAGKMTNQVGRIKVAFDNLMISMEQGTGIIGNLSIAFASASADIIDGFNNIVTSKSFKEFFVRLGELSTNGTERAIANAYGNTVKAINENTNNAPKGLVSYKEMQGFYKMSQSQKEKELEAQKKLVDAQIKEYNLNKDNLKIRDNMLWNAEKLAKMTANLGKKAEVIFPNTVVPGSGGDDKGGKSKKSQTNISDILGDLSGVGLNEYDAKIAKIRVEYEKLVKKISESTGSKADISQALKLADAKRQFDELKVSVDRYTDALKKNSGISGNQYVGLSGTMFMPGVGGLDAKNPFTKTTAKLSDNLSKEISKGISRGIGSALSDLTTNIGDLGSNFYEVFSNVFQRLSSHVGGIMSDVLGRALGEDLTKKIESGADIGALGSKTGKALIMGAQLAGGVLGSVISKTSYVGQGASGALSGIAGGVATGAAIGGKTGGIWGGVIGGVLGLVSGLFGASEARKQRELQEKQLAEQRKQTAMMEREALLTYQSSVRGVMTRNGVVSSVERDAYGDLVANIKGSDIELVLERTKSKR